MSPIVAAKDPLEERFPTIPSVVEAARKSLPPEVWDHASGGVEFETGIRRNRDAFERIGFRPRLMQDVRGRTCATTFLGQQLSLPVMLAPMGAVHLFDPGGGIAQGRVAERTGTLMFLSTEAPPGMEAIRAAGVRAPIIYQLYTFGGKEWITQRMRVVEDTGCIALCFTADAAVSGNRDRKKRNRYVSRTEEIDFSWREHFTWDDFDWLRSITKLPVLVKGITHAEDAKLAVEHGAAAVYVSNHGGRQLDHLPGGIDVLPEVVEAVAGRVPVIFDSGILRGSDVVKAIALGATAVSIGKLQAWALGAGGEPLLERVLGLLRGEILSVMGLLGVSRLADLGPQHLRPIVPMFPPGWPGYEPPAGSGAPRD